MILNGTDYGKLWNSSGARGFFGDNEYWYHRYWRMAGLDYDGWTFVAKTTTTLAREGNMPLDRHWRPRELKPRCIVVKPVRGVVLNAVGLSGPGARAILRTNKWQKRTSPFVLSYMPTGDTHEDRVHDAHVFSGLLNQERPHFASKVALQVNLSCPNVGHGGNDPYEIGELLSAIRWRLPGVPLIPKFNALEPVETIAEVARMNTCDAVAVGNTIPWGRAPHLIDWKHLFGSDKSPLAEYGGGGLSGWPLLPLTIRWVAKARSVTTKPIIAGGGVLSAWDARSVLAAGADVLELGVVGMIRPWRMRGIRDAVLLPVHPGE